MGNLCLDTSASESQSGQQQQQSSSTHGLSEQSNLEAGQPHAVRFASVNQEIEPDQSLQSLQSLQSPASDEDQLNGPIATNRDANNTKDDIRSLALNLQDTRLQESRLRHFAFEPVSLPASRVCTLLPHASLV